MPLAAVIGSIVVMSSLLLAMFRVTRRTKVTENTGELWKESILSIIVLLIVAERMIFYAFVDATLFPINDDRHLFASNILLAPPSSVTLLSVSVWSMEQY